MWNKHCEFLDFLQPKFLSKFSRAKNRSKRRNSACSIEKERARGQIVDARSWNEAARCLAWASSFSASAHEHGQFSISKNSMFQIILGRFTSSTRRAFPTRSSPAIVYFLRSSSADLSATNWKSSHGKSIFQKKTRSNSLQGRYIQLPPMMDPRGVSFDSSGQVAYPNFAQYAVSTVQ